MSNPIDADRMALADSFENAQFASVFREVEDSGTTSIAEETILPEECRLIAAALRAPRRDEPVAWRSRVKGAPLWADYYGHEPNDGNGIYEVQPLYAHPAEPQGARELVECLTGCAQILDVAKGEWTESWIEWDQSIRDLITKNLQALSTSPSPDRAAALPMREAFEDLTKAAEELSTKADSVWIKISDAEAKYIGEAYDKLDAAAVRARTALARCSSPAGNADKPSEFWAGKASAAFVLTQEIKLRKQLTDALKALLEAVRAEPAMRGRHFVGLGIQVTNAISAAEMAPRAWECMGRKQSLPEPGECCWPDCGCDEHATKVIESLLEQGWMGPQEAEKLPTPPALTEKRPSNQEGGK